MNRILLTGKNGQVGWELQRALATLGEVIALDRHGMDLADPDSIRRAVREHNPNLIVNVAAYTAVDKAEEEPDLAMAINGIAPGILAEEAKRLGAAMIHYSTDYVFDGNKDGPYTEEDVPNPLNIYGKTKLVGEQAIQAVGVPYLIFRTSWVYGTRGKNFLLTILRLAKERDELRIVYDQIGAPTWSRMIAEATGQCLTQFNLSMTDHQSSITDLCGTYHLSAAGVTSWYGFAIAIFRHAEAMGLCNTPTLEPIPTEAYLRPALRPANSVLASKKIESNFRVCLPDWQAALQLCLDEL